MCLENCFSSVTDVIGGVPQGSVLGPVLFLIFLNDVTLLCSGNTTVKLFADDLKLYIVFIILVIIRLISSSLLIT